MCKACNTLKYTKENGSKRAKSPLVCVRPAGDVEKSCATGCGAVRISNDEMYRATWGRNRRSQRLIRPQPPPPPAARQLEGDPHQVGQDRRTLVRIGLLTPSGPRTGLPGQHLEGGYLQKLRIPPPPIRIPLWASSRRGDPESG